MKHVKILTKTFRDNTGDELFSLGTRTIVEYISPECILEGLNILQTANEVNS